jgi:glycosyltransferase involved in cell wall biosynthesis
LAGLPMVVGTFHVLPSVDVGGLRNTWVHRRLERRSNAALDRVIAVSGATNRDWVARTGIDARRVLTIPNGIDPEQFRRRWPKRVARKGLGLPDDEWVILGAVGRLDAVKGFEYLIEALARLKVAAPKVRLVLAGEGPLRGKLEALARRTGVGDSVHFVGFQADIQQVYDALDVFVLSSLSEALPYVLLEAMATELPCVGSNVGGVPEIIAPGETGFLVPPSESAALAVALQALLESPASRQRMGQAGRERILRDFNIRDMVRRTIQVYKDLLKPLSASVAEGTCCPANFVLAPKR